MARHVLIALVLASIALASSSASRARDKALQSSCFPSETLKAIPGEERTIYGIRRFDTPEKARELRSIAPLPSEQRGSIRRVDIPGGRKVIALTFDLCETRNEISGYDGPIFDYLRAEGVKATVFAGGKWMRSHLARSQQLMTDPLFEMASHSEDHRNVRKLEGAALSEEILGPQRAYERIHEGLAATQCAARVSEPMQSVAPRISLFRFPFGACNAASMTAVNEAGLAAIQWDVSIGDSDKGSTAAMLSARILRNVKPGSIVIAHANGRGWHTAAALRLAIPKLKAQGYEFATVSELLSMGKPVVAATCYDSRPGDTDRYDFLMARKAPGTDAGTGSWLPTSIFDSATPKSEKKPRAKDEGWNPNAEPFAGR